MSKTEKRAQILINDAEILANLGYEFSFINPVLEVEVVNCDENYIMIKSFNRLNRREELEMFSIDRNQGAVYYCMGRATIKTNDNYLFNTVEQIISECYHIFNPESEV